MPHYWNTTPAEEIASYPAETYAAPGARRYLRAITVVADSATTFRWVCQVRVAPYSYDWLDNLGRRSPRRLTPGLDDLRVGQRFATIFRIVDAQPGRSVTAAIEPGPARLFGDVVMTYRVSEAGTGRSRVVCCLVVGGASRADRFRRTLLGWGDLVMMRKQLKTLKELAETAPRS